MVNGNQLQFATLASGVTSYTPFPGNVIPQSMIDSTATKTLPYIAQTGPYNYYLNSNGLIANIYDPRLHLQGRPRLGL